MSARYALKPKASRDLDDQADYLVDAASMERALRFFDAAYSTFALLATLAKHGMAIPAQISAA